jgi:hypothetical protein
MVPELHVYWQVVPLQVGVPVVVLHALVQDPQWVGTLSGVQVPLQVVSRHEHVPAEQSGVGCAHAVPFTQVPALLHVWGMFPLQFFALGVHATQAPLRQTGLAPEQVVPGVQAPATQVWGTLPMHSVWPGAQTPPHAPLEHVMFTHATGEPHCPLALHVWTPLPAVHWVVLGVHATHMPLPRHTGLAPEHVVWFWQVTQLSQAGLGLPSQRVWPATQLQLQSVM